MKKISVVLFIVICLFTVSSCSLFGLEPVAWKTDRYIIGLTFHNSNGEDLLAPFYDEADPNHLLDGTKGSDFYSWNIIPNHPNKITNCESICQHFSFLTLHPFLSSGDISESNGTYTLINWFWADINDEDQEKITYKFTCPALFEDESVHELVAYWDTPFKHHRKDERVYARCTKMMFDGKEISPRFLAWGEPSYVADIVL